MGMTIGQVRKINEKVGNNFKFDLRYYTLHGEKTLEKRIDLDEKHYICAKLYFGTYFMRAKNAYGQYFNVPTKNSVIKLRVSKYTICDDGTAVSYGIGFTKDEEEILERKMFNKICKASFADQYSDENILKFYNEELEKQTKRLKEEV